MSALGREAGFTQVELLVASVLLIVVLVAVLAGFEQFERNSDSTTRQNEAQETARRALGEVAREIRSLSSPTNELPNAIERHEPADIVFQAVAPVRPAGSLNQRNTRRVRYCLDGTGGAIWRQEQNWTSTAPPALPTATACPAAAVAGEWTAARQVADKVVNGTRPLFTYNSTDPKAITEVRVRVWVDVDPAARPRETQIETGLFLRNQNRAPSASFTASVSGTTIVLNGSASADPEGKALNYFWYDGGVLVGEGIVLNHTPSTGGSHSITLRVKDPAGLEHTSPAQTVCIVTSGSSCP